MDSLKRQAQQLIEEWDPYQQTNATFQTVDQHKDKDEYFMRSGGNVSFFLEEDAMDEKTGLLKQDKQQSVNKIGHAQHYLDPVFRQFSMDNRRFGDLLSQLGLLNAVCPQSMYICKPPHIGGYVSPHCDNEFLFTNPLSTLGLWFAVDDATLENGCLYSLKGSHKTAPRKRFVRDPNNLNTSIWESVDPAVAIEDVLQEEEQRWKSAEELAKFTALPAKKGTCVVLHGSNIHMSYANTSGVARHAYTMHAVDGARPWAKENWLHNPAIQDEFPVFAQTYIPPAATK
jgi:phytanoyl-CoA hydroxylase